MSVEQISEEEKVAWWIFLTASPLGVVAGTPEEVTPQTLSELPENVRRVLLDDRTAARIFLLGQQFHLADERVREVARLVKMVFVGEASAADLEKSLRSVTGIAGSVAATLATRLTQDLITSNYFQIARVYEKKHKTTGSRELGVGTKSPTSEIPAQTSEVGTGRQTAATPPAASPRAALTPPARPASPNVVDLRNGSIPSRLPPTPRVAPLAEESGAKWSPPPLVPYGPKASQTPRPRTPTTPAPAAPAFFPMPKPPVPALPAPVKPLPPESENNRVPPPTSPPAPRIQGTPLDHITPSGHPAAPVPPRPATTSPAPPIPPLGSGAHGPLPPEEAGF